VRALFFLLLHTTSVVQDINEKNTGVDCMCDALITNRVACIVAEPKKTSLTYSVDQLPLMSLSEECGIYCKIFFKALV
jgi:hypothetical protein